MNEALWQGEEEKGETRGVISESSDLHLPDGHLYVLGCK